MSEARAPVKRDASSRNKLTRRLIQSDDAGGNHHAYLLLNTARFNLRWQLTKGEIDAVPVSITFRCIILFTTSVGKFFNQEIRVVVDS